MPYLPMLAQFIMNLKRPDRGTSRPATVPAPDTVRTGSPRRIGRPEKTVGSSSIVLRGESPRPSGSPSPGRRRRPPLAGLASLAFVWLGLVPAQAKLPEPDAVLYGTLTIDGIVATASRTDLVIEARRIEGGTVLASYRMGSDPTVGNRYVLRVPVEALTPPIPPRAAALGETVNIQVRSSVQVLTGQVQTLAERGQLRRLDFTVGNASDNGLPDDWEIAYFGAAGQDPNGDPDADGRTTRQEYESGTNPVSGDDVLALAAAETPAGLQVSFVARRAEGAGYAGKTRRFTLEASSTPEGGWAAVPSFSNLAGNNQVVAYTAPAGGLAAFFRLRVVLE